MKYYKLVEGKDYKNSEYTEGKIYEESYIPKNTSYWSVSILAKDKYPKDWQEVEPVEYYLQEKVMPKYFAIKRVADNPLWKEYIKWLNLTTKAEWSGDVDSYYGYATDDNSHGTVDTIKEFGENAVELTLEQWDSIINKKDMKEKEIIGWKLKEDCRQYEGAASKICGYCSNKLDTPTCVPGVDFLSDSDDKDSLKKAGVLELWFEPVYKQEEIFKIGDWCYDINDYYTDVRNRCLPILEIKNNEVWCKDFIGKSQLNIEDFKKYYRKATYSEIEEALITEANKRGYKEGVLINPYFPDYSSAYSSKNQYKMNSGKPFYEPDYDSLRMGGSVIYHKGEWAEILPSYPNIEVNGYKGEFFENYVQFGCAKIRVSMFHKLWEIITNGYYSKDDYKNIETITLGKGTFTKQQIKEISEYYNSIGVYTEGYKPKS